MENTIFISQKERDNAESAFNKVSISNADGVIVHGVLQEKLQLGMEANWDNIFNVSNRFQLIQAGLATLDIGVLNTGLATRRFYKGGSYLKTNIKFRVIDWDKRGNVISDARNLIKMSLPQTRGSITKAINAIEAKYESEVEAPISKADGFIETTQAVGSVAKSLTKQAYDAVKETGKRLKSMDATLTRNRGLGDKGLGSNSPIPVLISVGNYFENVFLIENLQIEFSKEMTASGPLYADFDMSVSTPEVAVWQDVDFPFGGLQQKFSKRVIRK